ncbi:MAG: nuclear transport factor 2 family protein [Gammaproteobacteria bacterium]|nr:MAG: nuclear transport factor 2 family protein [Gammaproteobacteria bacterium]
MSCDSCAIKNVIYRYADLIDRGDFRGVAAMFSRGKIVSLDGQGRKNDIVGEEAIYGLYSNFTRLYQDDGSPHTLHMTSNVMVDVDEAGKVASSQSYAVVFQVMDDFPLQPIIGVRYYDTFAKIDEAWHFTERQINTRLMGDLSRHLLRPI